MENAESALDEGYRINEQITIDPIRLIDNEGKMLGVVSLKTGLEKAEEVGLDLVEVSPNAKPPVCKIMENLSMLHKKKLQVLKKSKKP